VAPQKYMLRLFDNWIELNELDFFTYYVSINRPTLVDAYKNELLNFTKVKFTESKFDWAFSDESQ